MKKRVARGLFVLGFLLVSVYEVCAQQGSEYLIAANRAMLERKFDEAIGLHNKYIALNKNDFRGYFNRGTVEYNAGYYSQAVASFSECLNQNKIYKEAYYYRGKSYQYLHKYVDAISDFSRILKEDSFSVPFLKARAETYELQLAYSLALIDLNAVLAISPKESEALQKRAELKTVMNLPREALIDYNALQLLRPSYKMVHFHKGNLFLALKQTDQACFEFDLAIKSGVVKAERPYEFHCKS